MNELVGTWLLRSFKVTGKDNITQDWRGGNSTGVLIYTADGYVSVSINSKVEDFKNATEAKSILDSCLFYAGTYKAESESVVTHFVTHATNPSRVGEKMVREFKLDLDLLSISASGDYGSSQLVWEKIK